MTAATAVVLCVCAAPARAASFTRAGQPGWFTFVPLLPSGGPSASVNVASGALLVDAHDVIPSAATDFVDLHRYYNSHGPTGEFGPAWTLDLADTHVDDSCTSSSTPTFAGPSGYNVTGPWNGPFYGTLSAPAGFEGTVSRVNAQGNCSYGFLQTGGGNWSSRAPARVTGTPPASRTRPGATSSSGATPAGGSSATASPATRPPASPTSPASPRCGSCATRRARAASGFSYASDSGRSAGDWNDGINTVDFRDPSGNNGLLDDICTFPGDVEPLGCEHSRHDAEHIWETDIGLNKRANWWTGIRPVPSDRPRSYDLWSLAAHEPGHSLGIAHDSEDSNAGPALRGQIMYYRFDFREERRYLGGSDYMGLKCQSLPC